MAAPLPAEEKQHRGVYSGYLEDSSAPLTCFFFTLPLFIVYHGGLWWLHSFSELRWANAADIAIANALGRLGMFGPLISFVVVVVAFCAMQALSGKPWRCPSAAAWPLMIVESCIFALPVFMLSRLVLYILNSVDLTALSGYVGEAGISWQTNMILSCGAGAYEEFLFRLVLMGLIVILLSRGLGIRSGWKYIIAAALQAVAFAVSHHLPGGPEAIHGAGDFRDYFPVFSFRIVAGVYFALLYVERGFGIAAGSHAVYDLLVVALDLLFPGYEI